MLINVGFDRECVRAGAAGAGTRRSLRHRVLHPQNFDRFHKILQSVTGLLGKRGLNFGALIVTSCIKSSYKKTVCHLWLSFGIYEN